MGQGRGARSTARSPPLAPATALIAAMFSFRTRPSLALSVAAITDGADVTSKILLAAATFLKDFPCAKIVRRSRGRRARARLAR